MNREAIKTEIENILSTVKQPLIKQYPAAKHQIAKLEELGLIEFMPTMRKVGIGYSNAAAVIEAATSAKTAVMNAYGEGEEIAASKLYELLNEKPEPSHINKIDGNLNAVREMLMAEGVSAESLYIYGWQDMIEVRADFIDHDHQADYTRILEEEFGKEAIGWIYNRKPYQPVYPYKISLIVDRFVRY